MTSAPWLFPEISRERADERCATTLLRSFAAKGVRAAFGIPGGAVGPLFDALAEVPEIELVSTRSESTAVFAAMGHARATGRPALVLVTAGPGVTNTITGLAAAMLEDLPVIVLGGDVATTSWGKGAFQDGSSNGVDVIALLRAVTRWSSVVNGPSMAGGAAERAWSVATGTRPGPVFLSVPFDVGQGRASITAFAAAIDEPSHPSVSACQTAARALMSAKRGLLVLGAGARHATQSAIALAERLSLSVVVTGHAKGVFPETHPAYLGIIGNAAHPSAVEYIAQRPDVVCIVGSRAGDFATNGWRLDLAGSRTTIQIDRDPWLIGRNLDVSLGIVGDAHLTLAAIDASIPREFASVPRIGGGVRRKEWSALTPAGLVKPQAALERLSTIFPNAIWCSDIGEHMGMAQHYLTVDSPDRFHCMSGLGSMGSGLGAAIGIKHAQPHETVIAIVGDGGFNMQAGDVLTCVEQGIGVLFAVFNDGRWNMVEHGFRAVFKRAPDHLPQRVANLAAVARGYGAAAEVIDHVDQLNEHSLNRLVRSNGPVVLDIRIDPSETLSTDTRSAALRNLGAGLPK